MRATRLICLSGSLLMLGSMVGCGAIYTPQEFEERSFTYGYGGAFDSAIEVLPLTFVSARTANADGYVPRSLPAVFGAIGDPVALPLDARLRSAGLETALPAATYGLPSRPALLDGDRLVQQPGLRNDARSPRPTTAFDPAPLVEGASTGERLGAAPRPEADLGTRLDRPAPPREAAGTVPPRVMVAPYTIGVGDALAVRQEGSLQINDAGSSRSGSAQQFLVQDNGEISLPGVGPIAVEGLTLAEARQVIANRLVADQVGLDPSVEIASFGSKKIAVSGLTTSELLPVTSRPTRLGEAITMTGGLGADPALAIVRVLRNGTIYEMSGSQIIGSSAIAGRVLIDGDIVSVTPSYDAEAALAYFDQQLNLRALKREAYADELTRRADNRAMAAERRSELQSRIQLENYRLEAEQLRQQGRIDRLMAQREVDEANEQARLANISARQDYLDRLRALETENRLALRQFESDTRQALMAAQAERARERSERFEVLRLRLEAEQRQIDANRSRAEAERTLFSERSALGAVEKDYVTVAGELGQQTVVALPFEGRMSLTRVLYEETRGIDRTTGDSSEIYVFRAPAPDAIDDPLRAYHLDASNPAALAVASLFEMRPNDVVYVNPQPITNWNRVITQILPSTGLLTSGVSALGN